MGVIKYRPQYPIITMQPGFGLLVRNMNQRDWSIFAGITAVSFPIGYLCGTVGKSIRTPLMWFAVAAGSSAGFLGGLLRSSGRLMGLSPNQAEAARYKYRLDITDYQVRTEPFRTVVEEELEEIQDNPRY
jgi:cytochrome c biogenesis protein CcdA